VYFCESAEKVLEALANLGPDKLGNQGVKKLLMHTILELRKRLERDDICMVDSCTLSSEASDIAAEYMARQEFMANLYELLLIWKVGSRKCSEWRTTTRSWLLLTDISEIAFRMVYSTVLADYVKMAQLRKPQFKCEMGMQNFHWKFES
jgi:hypothetical protein